MLVGRRSGVKGVVDALDGFVDSQDLAYVLRTIKSLANKFYFDEESNEYITATEEFLWLYNEDEGANLVDDVNSVGTKTLPTGSEKLKRIILATIKRQAEQPIPEELVKKAQEMQVGNA